VADLVFDHVSKRYGKDDVLAVNDMNLDIRDGEFIVLVGPSGCGKSTALRMVAGLEEIDAGDIRIGGRTVKSVPPGDRDVAMVFQSYALYPHMTVYQNFAFSLKLRKRPKAEIDAAVRRAAAILDLEEFLSRKPGQLSGGQRQRVALGRAIVREPAVFLMDEPLSNLDAQLRAQTRVELLKLHRDLGTTFIYVTHDQVEAMTMGDRIVVMRHGIVQQVDSPRAIYERPNNVFVAKFIGNPPMNLLPATVAGNGTAVLEGNGVGIPLPTRVLQDNVLSRGAAVLLGFRPERIVDGSSAADGWPRLQCCVDVVEMLGSEVHVHVTAGSQPIMACLDTNSADLRQGDVIQLAVSPDQLHVFDSESERALVHPSEH
jgi:multiple sugar transport system ATP-binding protein